MTDSTFSDLISHLLELRSRLVKAVVGILVATVALLPFANNLYAWLALPLVHSLAAQNGQMIATGVASPFLTPFKLALISGIFFTMPITLYQLWAFIAPGLYRNEKRTMLPLLAGSIFLFYAGGAFAYFVVFPLVFSFLVGVAPEGVQVATDITNYLDFSIKMFFAFGIAFQVPIATILLIITDFVSPKALSAKRPYVIVGSFVLGMLLTPPDIISQTLLALPMWILFEIGVVLGKFLSKKPESVPGSNQKQDFSEDEDPFNENTQDASSPKDDIDEDDFFDELDDEPDDAPDDEANKPKE